MIHLKSFFKYIALVEAKPMENASAVLSHLRNNVLLVLVLVKRGWREVQAEHQEGHPLHLEISVGEALQLDACCASLLADLELALQT